MPDENEDLRCSNCGGKCNVGEYNTPSGARIKESKVNLCAYCACSAAGNAFFYPNQYGDAASVLKGVAAMINKLEQRLKQK